ncbi:uncharacterized protein LOC103641717 [Zea mays]|uniref:uncharacterized protein LOC103641717 n=1 Tax=Zea mays TaxID=4577 RepID=UPI0022B9B583|nr:uncharacterized protein LOC103641717 [Zea mays]
MIIKPERRLTHTTNYIWQLQLGVVVCHASLMIRTSTILLCTYPVCLQQGSEAKADLAREKAHTPTTPPKGADAKATTTSGTVRTSPPTN